MTQRILVTAALPYANGALHIGHLVEYCQADIYVRALKRLGENAVYICASDAHGTPIELNAARLGVAPEALVQEFHAGFQRDFPLYDVQFDHFSSTHSDTNRETVEGAYASLKDGKHLHHKSVDGNWCENDQRFLPDRFIRGTCPRCGAEDQYGDVCESCGATYAATDLKSPRCSLCGNPPVIRASEHAFFTLSADEHVDFLRRWIDSGTLQEDVANYVRNWVEGGLRDWCISRDGPYFGFAIPGLENKFFYVWLDAPFGYVSSSKEWAQGQGVAFDELWQSDSTRIEHFIGKDIVYFHTLFWPAVLNAIGYNLPSKVHVHGMLTVDGEKMSKSRGTFIKASTFAQHLDPQTLRYYYASKYSTQSDDLDLSFDDFVNRINAELVNKHANLFSRAANFINQKLDGRLGDLPFDAAEAQKSGAKEGSPLALAQQVVGHCRNIESLYREREFGAVIRELVAVADIGNEFMQAQMPWAKLKEDPEAARTTCTFALNVCHALAMYLWPIVPRFADAAARILDVSLERMDASLLFADRNRAIGPMERLFDRISRETCEAIVEAERQQAASTNEPKTQLDPPLKETIAYDQFAPLDLRVGKVVSAERVPKSKKLLKLQVDVGEGSPRQVVAGIAQSYAPEKLVGSRVVVLANLAPAKLMGVESQGMILAAEDKEGLALLRLDRDLPPGSAIR